MTPVERALMQALSWHALFGFPLTIGEARLASPSAMTLEEACFGLASLRDATRIGERDGLYFLAGRTSDVDERHARYAFAERKFKRALRFFRVARHLPFLRAAFVCNTLARGGARDGSDIDILLVAKPKHLWTARLFVTGFAALLGIRPTAHDAKDGICLSFFASEDALDFRVLAIERDAYLPRWLADVYPIYDEAGISEKLFAANDWMRGVLPNALPPRASSRRSLRPRMLGAKRLVETLLGGMEPIAKRTQLRIMPEALKNGGVGVTISDSVLKFHDHDRRAELRDRYEALCSSAS